MMNYFKRLKFKYKIILVIQLVSFIIIGFAIAFFLFLQINNYKRQLVYNRSVTAKLLSEYNISPLVFNYPDRSIEVLSKLASIPDVLCGVVYDSTSNVFAAYRFDEYSNLFIDLEKTYSDFKFKGHYLHIIEPIYFENAYLGSTYLLVEVNTREQVMSQLPIFILIVIGLGVITFLLSNILHRYISQPIFDLVKVTEKISKEKDYTIRIDTSLTDEIGMLYREFNQMLEEILKHNEEQQQAQNQIRELNEELEQRVKERTAELEYVNNELRDFAYITSHDLKSPLRGISQLAQWLEQDYADKFDDNGRDLLRLMKERVNRMNSLIDDILEYSRIGRKDETKRQIDIGELIKNVIQLMQIPQNVQVNMVEPFPMLIANPTRIEQIFLNLLSNSIKYNDKPICEIAVSYKEQEGTHKFTIQDNGPGIPEKYHKKVFGMFQSLESNQNKDSTGVGLAVVKKIVDLYKGEVWIESTENEGATFVFTLSKRETDEF